MEFRKAKALNFEETYPGCLGRMMNLLDFSAAVTGNRLLTSKPHCDDSPLSRSQPDMTRISPNGDQMGDKMINSDLKSDGTSMKMLIAHEMSKEVEFIKCNPPGVVAKLMGLDTLPQQQPDSTANRSHLRGHSWSHSGVPLSYWQQEHDKETKCEINNQYEDRDEFEDVYQIWQQTQKTNYVRGGRQIEPIDDTKMALIRQKFAEAKRQDALKVLGSNKDLFLKILHEPDSLQPIPQPPKTKRITVLRPSKMVDDNMFVGPRNKNHEANPMDRSSGMEKNNSGVSPSGKANESPQPTRIVVLKPSSLLKIKHSEESYGKIEDCDAKESREVAKEIARLMHGKMRRRHPRDETSISSLSSDGYTGDLSPFNKSQNEYAADNINNSEVTSPVSTHSLDYINRFGSSPCSSFSRASYSPESPVCKEAKKRLSERWAMIASTGNFQDQRHAYRGSSTLGEMLALSDAKKSVRSDEQEPRSLSLSTSDSNKEQIMGCSPINLMRSKSLPVSSPVYCSQHNVEASETRISKSSFTGKVSSLFFSKSKTSIKGKSPLFQSGNDSQFDEMSVPGDRLLPVMHKSPSEASSANVINAGSKQRILYSEVGVSLTKPVASGNPNETQDQPSPISVLETQFDFDDPPPPESSCKNKLNQQGAEFPVHILKSNLIDKSPPIGSISRTLSWDDYRLNKSNLLIPLLTSSIGALEEEEHEWFSLVQALLSSSEGHFGTSTIGWNSPERLLDLSLRDEKCVYAKRRSTRKLVFDCINEVLMEKIEGGGRTHKQLPESASTPLMVDMVWARMKERFFGNVRLVRGGRDGGGVAVEGMVRREVVGRGWVEDLRLEIDGLGKQIEGKLMEELVEEAVVELTAGTL